MICDAHCHFFSTRFFDTLARQRGGPETGEDLTRELGWEAPGTDESLADRWVGELDARGISRATLIASVPGDETSVAAAVRRHPTRLVGFFMLDPTTPDAPDRARHALTELALRGVCLFPAMHHVRLHDDRVGRIAEVAASHPGTAVFVHCGVLSVGVRKRLGLPSRFDMHLGHPLDLHRLATMFPTVPFIIPHFGAGMLREALMVADVCANVYLDTSSSNSWIRYIPGLTLDAVFRQAVQVLGASRLLFGTDSSFFPRGWQTGIFDEQKRIVEGLGVSGADRALIFGGNFERIFHQMEAAG
jgi:predicted TIM-barrel fold metal-dependent hydrolase